MHALRCIETWGHNFVNLSQNSMVQQQQLAGVRRWYDVIATYWNLEKKQWWKHFGIKEP